MTAFEAALKLRVCIPTYWWGGNFETVCKVTNTFPSQSIPTYWWGGNFETLYIQTLIYLPSHVSLPIGGEVISRQMYLLLYP